MHPCLVDLQQAFAITHGLIRTGSLCVMMLLLLCKLKSVQLLLLSFWREFALVVFIGAVSYQCVLCPFVQLQHEGSCYTSEPLTKYFILRLQACCLSAWNVTGCSCTV